MMTPQPSEFEDEYLDVLQNIEFGIVHVYKAHPEMTDWDALNALEALIRTYQAEGRGKTTSSFSLTPLSQKVFESVRAMCEWRLGREKLYKDGEMLDLKMTPLTLDEMVACLKRIRRSINMWNRNRGQRGYLSFIVEFVK
jgi:hypothetical protein